MKSALVPRMLDSMPRLVRGHADSGDGIRGIDRLGERQLLRHRFVVVGRPAVGADTLQVDDACPAQQGRCGLRAREPAPAPDLRIPVEGALHPRARPSESSNPGRMKRKYIGLKNIALPLHGNGVVVAAWLYICLCPPATRARRWPSRDRRLATTAVATMVLRSC